MWKDFKAFLTKSNALALALGVVIGASVGKVVSAIVDDLIMPVVGLVNRAVNETSGDWRAIAFGPPDEKGHGVFKVGHFIGTLLDFFIVALVIFLVTKLVLRQKEKDPPPPTKDCPFCLASIPLAATKCQACTSVVT